MLDFSKILGVINTVYVRAAFDEFVRFLMMEHQTRWMHKGESGARVAVDSGARLGVAI